MTMETRGHLLVITGGEDKEPGREGRTGGGRNEGREGGRDGGREGGSGGKGGEGNCEGAYVCNSSSAKIN